MGRLLEIVALLAFFGTLAIVAFCGVARGQSIPHRAFEYRQTLRGEAARIWGMGQSCAIFAAQIHQESAWRPDAQSPFARGIAQFTPDTEEWIERLDPELRRIGGGAFNPRWGIRALVYYDRWLWERMSFAADSTERWAFTLASYNGGAGHIPKERALCRSAESAIGVSRPVSGELLVARSTLWRDGREGAALTSETEEPSGLGAVGLAEEVVSRSESPVPPVVLSLRHRLQIIWQKVRSIFVNVVDEDPARKADAHQSLGDKAMDVSGFPVEAGSRVSVEQEDAGIEGQSHTHENAAMREGVISNPGSSTHPEILPSCDDTRWYDHVEKHCRRAAWACKENRDYPRRIQFRLLPIYEGF